MYDRHCCRRKCSFIVISYPILNIPLVGKNIASVLDFLSPIPTCMFKPIILICVKAILEPNIASDLFVKIKAPSSTYRSKNNSYFVNGR